MGYVEDLRGKKQGEGRPRWRARYRDPSGRERSKSFARKIDAERFLVAMEDAKLRGAYVDPAAGRVPFREWAERWERTTATLRPSTRKDYATLLKNQVLPEFGDLTLAGIDVSRTVGRSGGPLQPPAAVLDAGVGGWLMPRISVRGKPP